MIFKIFEIIGINKMRRRNSPNNHNGHNNLNNPNKKGFTIAEMIMVVLIISALTIISGRTYFTERDRFEFNNAFIEMTGMIKEARNLATTSQSVYISAIKKNVVPADGYGIYINLEPDQDKPHFTLFANLGPGADYEDYLNEDSEENARIFDNNDKIIKTFTIPSQVQFHSFYFDDLWKWDEEDLPNPAAPNATEAVIIFKPPLAETLIGNNDTVNPEELDKLGLKFFNPAADDNSPKKCIFIRFNRIKTFPAIEYDNIECNPE